MKKTLNLSSLFLLTIILSCYRTPKQAPATTKIAVVNDTVKIVNKELEYEVIIIDPGYSTWLASRALPRNYHSQKYLETKNLLYITEWNARVMQPQTYSPQLYEMTIDYQSTIDYGYEVNYLIYNYMIFFQNTYKQILYGNVLPK